MDPDAPRPVRDVAQETRRLTRVQKWVISSLVTTTIVHLSVGLVLAAMTLDLPKLSSQIGLNILAAAFGIVAVAAGLAVHGHKLLTWWLLLGTVPGIIGIWLTLR
jgi:hypothetical protein